MAPIAMKAEERVGGPQNARALAGADRIWPVLVVAVAWTFLVCSGGARAGEFLIGERFGSARTLAPLVKKLVQSVVNVKASRKTVEADPSVNLGLGAPGGPSSSTTDVYGAGIVVEAELGLIVTSNDLVKDAEIVQVRLPDGRQVGARLEVADARYDLAILRISTSGLTAARLGRSSEAETGDFVVAVGNPLGLGQSVSFGIISGLHRSWPGIPCQDLIQTDAVLDSGSFGGPLFNLRGEVIGIVAVRSDEIASGRGFGLAVPSDAIDRLLARLP